MQGGVKKRFFHNLSGMVTKKTEKEFEKELQKELIEIRRYLHENAEVGFALGRTVAFVKAKLAEFGYTPQDCGKSGVVATLGDCEKGCILLRADMDALPMREKTGLPFACKEGNMHACGHDLHTAMLLGSARLLKSKGVKNGVKFLFQPAEEILQGASDALKNGVLIQPAPQVAFALHVSVGTPLPTGKVVLSTREISAPCADYFHVRVKGKSCHGATPEAGVDALTATAHILLGLQSLSAREQSVDDPFVLTVGALRAGSAGNAIPDEAELQGTFRAYSERTRARIKKRLIEIVKAQAKAFRAKGEVAFEGGCPTLKNDLNFMQTVQKAIERALGKNAVITTDGRGGGSEDFAYISHEIPSVLVVLSAGQAEEGYEYPLHHPKTKFDESVLLVGSKLYASVAEEWLTNR